MAGPSRLRLAFTNVWNLAALGAAGVVSVVTKSPLPLLAAGALEAGWLAFATRPRASRVLFPAAHAARARSEAHASRSADLARLSDEDRARVERLETRAAEIRRHAASKKGGSARALAAEVARLDDVIAAFVELAASARAWRAALAAEDPAALEAEQRRAEAEASRALDEDIRAAARAQLELCVSRRAQLDEMRRRTVRADDQLELVETTFKVIAGEILLFTTADDLRAKLDDLSVGVRAVREAVAPDAEPDPTRRPAAVAAAAATQARRI